MLCMGLTACNGKKEVMIDPAQQHDSINTTPTDSVAEDSVQESIEQFVPKRADELFDDFAFNFMKNSRFQRSRIIFPLVHVVDGKAQRIEKRQWKFDRMYAHHEVYTLIFADPQSEAVAKDTSLTHVVVENLNLNHKRTKSYDFVRKNGQWHLVEISEQAMGESENSDFYRFYHRFATDSLYRQQHIHPELKFITSDEEGFERIEGTLMPEQWADFGPELPRTHITNILYGQSFKNSKLRILSIRTLSGGMDCTLTFQHKKGKWILVCLEN